MLLDLLLRQLLRAGTENNLSTVISQWYNFQQSPMLLYKVNAPRRKVH